jgi:lipoate-protein ligase A
MSVKFAGNSGFPGAADQAEERRNAHMGHPFRVIDTGLRDGRTNIAFDQALIEAHKAQLIPDTIRFLSFPPTVLVGRHQAMAGEVRLDHCRANGIGTARRITGGGAIYFDQGQLGWELVFARATLGLGGLGEIARAICEAAAAGLGRLGVAARFRPRNDIEVDGRKLCGTGGFFDGDTIFYQGTLLIDCDPAAMVAALNVPTPKLAKRGLDSVAQRVVTLKELLGPRLPPQAEIKEALLEGLTEGLGLTATRDRTTPEEEKLAQRLHDEEIGTDGFVFEIDDPSRDSRLRAATQTTPGGRITAYLRVEGAAGSMRVRDALITGDFFAAPPRIILDLEAALRGASVEEVGPVVDAFFTAARAEVLSVTPGDFRAALEQAARHDE